MRRFQQFAVASLIILGSGLGSASTATAGDESRHARENSTLFAMGQAGAVLLASDVRRGTTEVIGPTGISPQSLALAITRDGRGAYTIAHAQDPAEAHLAKINLATGAETLVGTHPLGQNLYVMGMTLSPDGVLYAGGDFNPASPTFNSLYTVDLITGRATRVGPFGVGSAKSAFIMSFSFDPKGKLYGASTTSLYTIDPRTGAATKVVAIVGATRVMGIAFDKKGNLYASDFIGLPQGSTIYRVDLETGVFTPLFKTGVAFVHNIAFEPEPGCGNGHNEGNRQRKRQCSS